MSIISYAQNFEDVMLWRALGHIERGLYIDIGAQDPIIDSVSLAFHEHGWQGIHVEPTPHYAELLRQQRPGDTVIQAAVGADPAVLPFFEIPDTGISTADAAIAAQHRARGFDVRETNVPCIPLSAVFQLCAEQEIHWLKIDVEGFEQQVLSSWGTSTARPWIVVVESTLPLTQIETHQSWESILLGYGYTSVCFDGLNRYYVSDTHPELKAAFASPPNVFDGFALNGTASAPFHQLIAARCQEKISATEKHLAELTLSQSEQERALRVEHAEREQILQQKLQALQDQADQEKAELTHKHGEQASALQIQYAEREQSLHQKLQALQEQLNRLQQERAVREQTLHEQNSQSRQELENLLRQLVQREQQLAAQLLKAQQQAEQEKTALARSHGAQERSLRGQYAEREAALTEQLQAGQQELKRLQQEWALREKEHVEQTRQSHQALESQLRSQVQREQEIAAQLLQIQQQAAQENTELARSHDEQERALQREHAERQQVLAQQLQTAQETLRSLERDWAHNEKALGKEIAALQHDVHALHHARQLLTQQHDAERSAKLGEHQRALAACAALEAELKAEVLFEQQASLQLRQSLAELQHHLDMVHKSLSWRMTAPLRMLASFIVPKSNSAPASPNTEELTRSINKAAAAPQSTEAHPTSAMPPIPISPTVVEAHLTTTDHEMGPDAPPLATHESVSESPSINIQNASIEAIMPPPAPVTMPPELAPASKLDELLAQHDQYFIECAYQTLLGRAPDPEGLGYYLGRLRTGFSKIRILKQLRVSSEGKAHAAKLLGLDVAIQRHQREHYPLIGWLFRLINGGEGNHPIERKLRGIENQIFVLGDESKRRFNHLETALAGLHHLVVQQTQSVAVDLDGKPKDTFSSGFINSIHPKELEGIKQLSPRARDIYFQLKTAATIYSGRAE